SELRRSHRLIGAKQSKHRSLQLPRCAGGAAASKRAGETPATAPQNRRGAALADLDHAVEIPVAFGIEDMNAIGQFGLEPARPSIDVFRGKLHQKAIADRAPISILRDGILP